MTELLNLLTGELKPINGAKISGLTKYNEVQWDKPPNQSFFYMDRPVPDEYLPGEDECNKTKHEDWSDTFGADGLNAYAVVACIKTHEADLGYLNTLQGHPHCAVSLLASSIPTIPRSTSCHLTPHWPR